jgi:hypothetical protein
MTIPEAISMLKAILKDRERDKGSPGNDAIQLGIEALDRVRVARDTPLGLLFDPLPGETEN